MAIQEGNIKLLKSQVMDDVDEGGGRATGNEILDGASNSIFNDISSVDRAYGRVNLRKVFVHVDTPDTDGYFGANLAVLDTPDDPKVSAALFTTKDGFDTRSDAQSRVESYLAQGPIYAGLLFGDHIAGQMTLSILQREGEPLPTNGDSFVLRKREGFNDETEQYVRVTNVSSRTRTFTDSNGDFKRAEVTLDLSDPLLNDFPGFQANRYDANTDYTGKTKFYATIVADAARYYGAVPLTVAGSTGDVIVKGEGIFTQIVPSTKVEIPIADARMNQQASAFVKAGDPLSLVITSAFSSSQAMYIGGGILPGSLTISRGGVAVTDKSGALISAGTQVGAIDYTNGIATLSINVFGTNAGSHTVDYTPAGNPVLVSSAIGIPVSQQNQRLNWNLTISPAPAKISLQVSYRVLGRWYVISEDGSGAIRGADTSFGAGSLNYTTGTVALTLGALPDVGSQIIFTWVPSEASRPAIEVQKESIYEADKFGFIFQLSDHFSEDIDFTWNDGVARHATVTGNVISGDATGTIDFGERIVRFYPNVLPIKGTNLIIGSTKSTLVTSTVPLFTITPSFFQGNIGAGKPWTYKFAVVIDLPVRTYPGDDVSTPTWVMIVDDGAGNLKALCANTSITVGTINYASGAFSVTKSIAGFVSQQAKFEKSTVFVESAGAPGSLLAGHDVTQIKQTGFEQRIQTVNILEVASPAPALPSWAWWTTTGAVAAQASKNVVASGGVSLSFTFNSIFLPRKLDRFALGASTYFFNPTTGNFTYNPSPTTGVGSLSGGGRGTLLGQTGTSIEQWVAGTNPTPTGIAGTLEADIATGLITESVTFRTAISPLFNGGFSIAGKFSDGTDFSATPDANGVIKTATNVAAGVVGKVDYENGIITLRFGKLGGSTGGVGVQDFTYLGIAGVANVTAVGVRADSLRYSAVGYSYIPLDAEILGLNPVRLPSDGRVPIFRKGGLALVHHTAKTNAATVSNGQTINCGRVRLARVQVIGNNGQAITTGYVTDLDAGTVTFNNVSGYSQPVRIEHRIEDLAMIRDAQIDGSITISRQLTHDFPLGSYVSSVLIIGDMKARVPVLFDQGTWTANSWSDELIGSQATATYNDVLAPIQVTNAGAITERWVVQFTNTTSFNVIGEHVGLIATGNTASDCAPINPAAGAPYFTIPAVGWGAGWSAGNILRLNTEGALFPVWVIRTIQQSLASTQDDSFTIGILGDIDRV